MRKAEVTLQYQPLIHEPPVAPGALYDSACQSDKATIEYWRHVWLGNASANHQIFGPFAACSIASEFQKYRYKPVIIAGSGPSLKINAHELKNRGDIPLVSCLHNFHFFEDLELAPEYYITLDAGPVTIGEVTEGGSKTEEEYWALTKDRTLIAYIATDPELLKKWKGKILFFSAPIPDQDVIAKMDAIEKFNVFLSSGGNVLGACLYFSKAVLGSSATIFVGADFSFGYNHKFHAWNSKYDASMGRTIRVTDIYGIKVDTWPSYWGFKNYFDSVSLRIPGIYYNCTEGGCLGSYPEGNLSSFKYMDLKECLGVFNANIQIAGQMTDPAHEPKMLLYS